MAGKGYRTISIPAKQFDRLEALREAWGLSWADLLDRLLITDQKGAGAVENPKPSEVPPGATSRALPTGEDNKDEDDFWDSILPPARKVGGMDSEEFSDLVARKVEERLPPALGPLQSAFDGLRRELELTTKAVTELSGRHADMGERIAGLEWKIDEIWTKVPLLEFQVEACQSQLRELWEVLHPGCKKLGSLMAGRRSTLKGIN